MLIDPENLFSIEGRPLHIQQALSKGDAKSLNSKPNNAALLTKLKKGTITFSELIELDREDKRHFSLAKRGLPVTEDNVDVGDKKEAEKRATHLAEKIEKMKNPNMKTSETRVLLKNVNKKLDEAFFKNFVKKIVEKGLGEKKVKNVKVLKAVKVLRNEEKGDLSKGIVFVEFVNGEFAGKFMEVVSKEAELVKEIVNAKGERVIIEHAFFDARELHKKEEMIKRSQERKRKLDEKAKVLKMIQAPVAKAKLKVKTALQKSKADPASSQPVTTDASKDVKISAAKELRLQRKIQKKAARENKKKYAQLLIEKAIQERSDSNTKAAIQAIAELDSRGARNRLKRKLEKTLGLSHEAVVNGVKSLKAKSK